MPGVVTALSAASEVHDGPYDLKVLRAPALSGWTLQFFCTLFESPLGSILYPHLARQSNLPQVLEDVRLPEAPLFRPHVRVTGSSEAGCETVQIRSQSSASGPSTPLADSNGNGGRPEPSLARGAGNSGADPVASVADGVQALIQATSNFLPAFRAPLQDDWRAPVAGRPTVADYAVAYRCGRTTPSEVVERIIDFVQRSEAHPSGCKWLVSWDGDDMRRQAAASTGRWRAGAPLSPLDGTPFSVKDFVDALPYPTTAGTTFVAAGRPVTGDCPYVAVLKAAGAVLIGKSALHEIGLGITGRNERTGTARNPYAPKGRDGKEVLFGALCGGSSSGAGALLAAGVCPIAIGTDGGGSIRIPSSFCGCVGLKPTNGRITSAHSTHIDCTVATAGPMAGCVSDVALLYSAMANVGLEQPPPGQPLPPPLRLPAPLPRAGDANPLKGLRVGLYKLWFDDCEARVSSACWSAVDELSRQGAVVDGSVVVPELEHLRVAHSITIASEMYHNFRAVHNDVASRSRFGGDVRLALSVARHWTAADYLQAQRIRARATTYWERIFAQVDVVVTPSTPCTAMRVPPTRLAGSGSDLKQTSVVMRYMVQGNMLGLPAMSIPVGQDADGMPIGLQLIGRPWEEATLLRTAAVLESALQQRGVSAGRPHVQINPLTGETRGL